ncbi:E3 ubiquitin-protein ligase TRIM71-like [Halichondria panicea]|uniref:E3 ubiquitin-protein ligase TRIM71-like n=1 Tax=Halichondria panicea TaxID=6063 RepID=UPI00312BA605
MSVCVQPKMSELVTKDAIKKLDAKLECLICLDTYKQPKLLPCYHVFCKSPCLEKLVTKDGRSLTCPTCRHIVPLSEKGVAGLQSDFHIDHLFEIRDAFGKVAELSKTQCGNCEEGKATGYCRDCEDLLCNNCQAAHQALKLTRFHHIVSLQEFQEEATKVITAKKAILTCSKHCKNELKIYCETCKDLICTDCTIRLHKDHNYDLVADVFPKHKEELVSGITPVKEKLGKVQQALKVFDTLAKNTHDQRAILEANIHREIDEQHRLLDQRRTELVGELDLLTQQKLKDLAAQRDQVEITQVKLASCLEYAEGALETGTECEVLKIKTPVLKRLEQISTEFKLDAIQQEKEITMKLTTFEKEPLKQSLKMHDDDEVIDSCSLKGENITSVRVKQAVKLELHLKRPHQNVEVVAAVTQTPIKCEIIRRDNKYEITYTPINRGKHEMNLTINGKHVQGSPFTVVAMSQPHTLRAPSRMISNLDKPWGVVVNSNSHVIVAERGSGQILVYDDDFKQIQVFDSQGEAPAGVAVDKYDNIYISDRDDHKIRKFTVNGDFLKEAGTKGDQRLQFNTPTGIGYNKTNDKIYVGDQYNNRIQVLNPDLTFHSIISINDFNHPLDVSFDRIGNTYVANFGSHNVKVFQSNGKLLRTFGTYGSGPGQLTNPAALAVSNTDTVYVVEMYGHRISVFKTNGEFICSFAKNGKEEGEVYRPAGIDIDSHGNIVVADRDNERLQVF